jgi:hypothetical protein
LAPSIAASAGSSRRAALQRRGHAEPGEEGAHARAEGHRHHAAQIGAEAPFHPALHEVQPEQEKRRFPRQLDQQPYRLQAHLRPSAVI